MLDKLEKKPAAPYEFIPPNDSYLDNIAHQMRETFNEESEGYIKYLEKKYLAPEFLFNEIDQNCLFTGIEHPQVIFEHIVNQILSEYYVDYKWYFYIHLFINKILKTIRPNANRPNEVINFNDYVTVRSIKWNTHLKWEYISGMVLENNVADRRMKSNILNPRIVIIEGSLTFDSSNRMYIDIENVIRQEKLIMKGIEKSLMVVNPHIIVYEKEVSRKIIERLRDIGYTVIMNVSKDEWKRLAWLTQTIVVPSIDFLDENMKWGTWDEFLIQAQLDDQKYSKSTAHYHTKYNAYFRGWNPALGCTVWFTGNDDKELVKVNEWFKSILDSCREELLGNGFEKKDYSAISKTFNISENIRAKTVTGYMKPQIYHPEISGMSIITKELQTISE